MFGRYANEYVNKEWLMDKIQIDCNPESYPTATPKDVFICALGIAETAPASPVMPIVQALWEPINDIIDGDVFRCSNCGTKNHVKTVMGKPDWKFCPECGARMNVEV